MTNNKPNPADFYLHTPAESSSSFVEWAKRLANDPGITFGSHVLDKHIIPLHPGDMMAIVARPGHGKSSVMAYMAKRVAKQIVEREAEKEECVVYVSWEQPVEELEAFFQAGNDYNSTDLAWGRVSPGIIQHNAIKRIELPVWMMGYSITDAAKKKPPMTVDAVYGCIRQLRDEFELRPILICLDYIQRIPVFSYRERAGQVTEATFQAKDLAMDLGCPIVAGVQAGRGVDKYQTPIPSMADCQWSSAIEQTADKQISLWRPIKTHDVDEYPEIDVGKHSYKNNEELLVIKLLKQRFEIGAGLFAVQFKPQTLEMYDYDLYRLPNNHEELFDLVDELPQHSQ